MHPKNPFAKNYKFEELIKHHADLEPFVFKNEFGTKTISFGNAKAVKALNTALLKANYGIDWDIPEGNLCPPIPSRIDYLLHIQDLFPEKKLHLLDIGTGANLIYPILGRCHFNWKCTATEVDLDSFKNAQEIIEKNNSLNSIDLRFQKYKYSILEHIILPEDNFDVVVCNPPFFKNQTEAERKNKRKTENLQLQEFDTHNFGGISNELWYKGGEEAFIKKMVAESILYKNQVQWFTSLVSNKEHLKNIKRAINKTIPTDVKMVEMEVGNKKSRFVAWTFQ